jgi:hypothetical protein
MEKCPHCNERALHEMLVFNKETGVLTCGSRTTQVSRVILISIPYRRIEREARLFNFLIAPQQARTM